MNELHAIDNWLHDKLVADTEIYAVLQQRVYKYALPQSPIFPSIVYSLAADTDTQGLGTVRILTRPLYLIKVVSKGAPSSLVNLAADRIDEIVGKVVKDTFVSSAGDEYAVSSRREAAVQFTERDPSSQQLYFHLGGLYRMEVFGLNSKALEFNDTVSLTDSIVAA